MQPRLWVAEDGVDAAGRTCVRHWRIKLKEEDASLDLERPNTLSGLRDELRVEDAIHPQRDGFTGTVEVSDREHRVRRAGHGCGEAPMEDGCGCLDLDPDPEVAPKVLHPAE